jgi:prepilin-type N-terminal cleavage/methylation domain-containing protein
LLNLKINLEDKVMKNKGFTLIELLVVISIIALLMSILMPALTKVRNVAKVVACSSNMRSQMQAQMAFTTDNRDKFPDRVGYHPKYVGANDYADSEQGRIGWFWALIDSYLPGDNGVVSCPVNDISGKSKTEGSQDGISWDAYYRVNVLGYKDFATGATHRCRTTYSWTAGFKGFDFILIRRLPRDASSMYNNIIYYNNVERWPSEPKMMTSRSVMVFHNIDVYAGVSGPATVNVKDYIQGVLNSSQPHEMAVHRDGQSNPIGYGDMSVQNNKYPNEVSKKAYISNGSHGTSTTFYW